MKIATVILPGCIQRKFTQTRTDKWSFLMYWDLYIIAIVNTLWGDEVTFIRFAADHNVLVCKLYLTCRLNGYTKVLLAWPLGSIRLIFGRFNLLYVLWGNI